MRRDHLLILSRITFSGKGAMTKSSMPETSRQLRRTLEEEEKYPALAWHRWSGSPRWAAPQEPRERSGMRFR
eukprot:198467-Pyramimonas_sp.AAC.1